MPSKGPIIQTRKKKPKPVRVKHVPIRTCITCRESGAKRGLTRLVRTANGAVEVDPSGKRNGRGAYLCEKAACWNSALLHGGLSRALNVTPSPESITSLQEFAASLIGANADVNDAAHSQEQAS